MRQHLFTTRSARRVLSVLAVGSTAALGLVVVSPVVSSTPVDAASLAGERLVTGLGGADIDGDIADASISRDGRWLVFSSDATNLVQGDTNGVRDVFAKDLQTGAVTMLSQLGGIADTSDADSYEPVVCADGSVVAFTTDTDLLDDTGFDFNFEPDVYVVERDVNGDSVFSGTDADTRVVRISLGEAGVEAQFGAYQPAISDDCEWVAFVTLEQFSLEDINDSDDVYLVSTVGLPVDPEQFGAPVLVSGTADAVNRPLGGGGVLPSLSADGRYVAFASFGNGLVAGADAAKGGVVRHDRDSDSDGVFDEIGAVQRRFASATSTGAASNGVAGDTGAPVITPDGTCVAFRFVNGFDLAANVTQSQGVFVRNFTSNTTTLASVSDSGFQALEADGATVSPDCRYVGFDSADTSLVAVDGNGNRDAFVRDLVDLTTVLVSGSSLGGSAAGSSIMSQMLADRKAVVLSTAAEVGGAQGGSGFVDAFRVTYTPDAPPAPKFTGISPQRLFDTRPSEPNGLVAVTKGKIGGARELRVKVTGVAGVPGSGVGAVSLNVTVTEPNGAGFITVYPCGTRPNASNLNFVGGQTIPNAVIAPVSANGEVCFFSNLDTHLLADVNGWFPAGGDFTGLDPKRVFDTRPSEPNGLVAVTKGKIGGARELRVKVTGVAGVPGSGVGAVSLNVTVTEPTGPGFITVYPCGTRPNASNLNFVGGQTVPNAVIAPVSANGEVCFFSNLDTHLLADVNGWFPAGGDFTGLDPKRVFDTRPSEPNGLVAVTKGKIGGARELRVKVTGVAGVPGSGVGAVSLNVTVTEPNGPGFITVYPCGTRPNASNLNFVGGQTIPNAVIAPVSANGEVCFFSNLDTHLLADVNGWFAS